MLSYNAGICIWLQLMAKMIGCLLAVLCYMRGSLLGNKKHFLKIK